jgi:hypothetical protein
MQQKMKDWVRGFNTGLCCAVSWIARKKCRGSVFTVYFKSNKNPLTLMEILHEIDV